MVSYLVDLNKLFLFQSRPGGGNDEAFHGGHSSEEQRRRNRDSALSQRWPLANADCLDSLPLSLLLLLLEKAEESSSIKLRERVIQQFCGVFRVKYESRDCG